MGNRGSRRGGRRGPGDGGIGGAIFRFIFEELLHELLHQIIDNAKRNNGDNEGRLIMRSDISAAMQADGSPIAGKSIDELRQLGINEDMLEQHAIKQGYTVKDET